MGTHGPAPASTALHSSRDGGSCGRSGGWAGLVLQQLNEHAHLWAQPRHHAGPNAVHCVLIAVHQALQQLPVEPGATKRSVMSGEGSDGFLFVHPLIFWFHKHVLHSLTSACVGATPAHEQNPASPPSQSIPVHSQTAIRRVLGQQKENEGNSTFLFGFLLP